MSFWILRLLQSLPTHQALCSSNRLPAQQVRFRLVLIPFSKHGPSLEPLPCARCALQVSFKASERLCSSGSEQRGTRHALPCSVALEGQTHREVHLPVSAEACRRAYVLSPLSPKYDCTSFFSKRSILILSLITSYLQEIAPLVCVPTVGDACLQFSEIYRRPEGIVS